MFKIFSFGFSDKLNLNNIGNISGVIQSFLDNIDLSEITKSYEEASNEHLEKDEETESSFIQLKQDDDMYLLTINLRGIDLRELSIRYDPGIIEVNANRSEVQRSGFGILYSNMIVKKSYNRKFENIEEIDTDQVLKNIDNGVLSIRMPKKYILESGTNIIEVDSIEVDSYDEDNVDNY
ncbi:hypothetical protein CDLVIII_0121 [Clostridium sp. DL-VIII]|uniref:Hsp20/alpha crystallin family protein n=1 Tax=Clostridium sp. DL-VIII TaxID=641107 RepID=UPI00023AF780|nr:Hsp20/alpha crystallin family protein [Clostridium sp. DL-VIII]EHI96860.1 hypothetical protein CDLVIII_0121 [Clostridium sp. DL-VIII]